MKNYGKNLALGALIISLGAASVPAKAGFCDSPEAKVAGAALGIGAAVAGGMWLHYWLHADERALEDAQLFLRNNRSAHLERTYNEVLFKALNDGERLDLFWSAAWMDGYTLPDIKYNLVELRKHKNALQSIADRLYRKRRYAQADPFERVINALALKENKIMHVQAYFERHCDYNALKRCIARIKHDYEKELSTRAMGSNSETLKAVILNKQTGAYPVLSYVEKLKDDSASLTRLMSVYDVTGLHGDLRAKYESCLWDADYLKSILQRRLDVAIALPDYTIELRERERNRLEAERIAAEREKARAAEHKARAMEQQAREEHRRNELRRKEVAIKRNKIIDKHGLFSVQHLAFVCEAGL